MTDYIPHSEIIEIFPYFTGYMSAIKIKTKSETYMTPKAFTTDVNGITGVFQQWQTT